MRLLVNPKEIVVIGVNGRLEDRTYHGHDSNQALVMMILEFLYC
jgi:hypothetical protein